METPTKITTTHKPLLSLKEIKEKYPNQWVLVINPELDDNLEIIRGEVVANCPTKEELYQKLHLRQGQSSAIEYTGNCDDTVVLI
ncbi:MAG: hypothetical protein AB4058_10830 [Microcystaceae cyanobacterium]